MKKVVFDYMVCTDDELELPCGVFSTLREVALFLRCSPSTVLMHMIYCKPIKGYIICRVLTDC